MQAIFTRAVCDEDGPLCPEIWFVLSRIINVDGVNAFDVVDAHASQPLKKALVWCAENVDSMAPATLARLTTRGFDVCCAMVPFDAVGAEVFAIAACKCHRDVSELLRHHAVPLTFLSRASPPCGPFYRTSQRNHVYVSKKQRIAAARKHRDIQHYIVHHGEDAPISLFSFAAAVHWDTTTAVRFAARQAGFAISHEWAENHSHEILETLLSCYGPDNISKLVSKTAECFASRNVGAAFVYLRHGLCIDARSFYQQLRWAQVFEAFVYCDRYYIGVEHLAVRQLKLRAHSVSQAGFQRSLLGKGERVADRTIFSTSNISVHTMRAVMPRHVPLLFSPGERACLRDAERLAATIGRFPITGKVGKQWNSVWPVKGFKLSARYDPKMSPRVLGRMSALDEVLGFLPDDILDHIWTFLSMLCCADPRWQMVQPQLSGLYMTE